MTRIIGGSAGGRRLSVPRTGTRPTADAVRESVFGALTSRWSDLRGVSVLDLYAGSGALGLEALSRGAARAVLVESDRRAGAVIGANLDDLGLAGGCLVTATVRSYLARPRPHAFDLVFADPPYADAPRALPAVLAALTAPAETDDPAASARPARWLADDAAVVLERSAHDRTDLEWPAGFWPWPARRYGDVSVHVAVWRQEEAQQ